MKIERLPVGPLQTNCYILYDENEKCGIIIDPGEDADRIVRVVKERGFSVSRIVLTHGHYDHIMALHDVQAAFPDAKLCLCHLEKDLVNDPYKNLTAYGNKSIKPVQTDILLKDGDLIPVGQANLKVIETPGHTIGSICLLGENLLISGDTLFYLGIGRCDLPSGNLASEVDSILNKLFLLSDDIMVYPGHGQETTIGFEKKNNEVYHYIDRSER